MPAQIDAAKQREADDQRRTRTGTAAAARRHRNAEHKQERAYEFGSCFQRMPPSAIAPSFYTEGRMTPTLGRRAY